MIIKNKLNFTKQLLDWHIKYNKRTMPWKGEKDPYKIWLSEIILQQTRVEQGLAYYNKFVQNFTTIKKLAAADETVVFKLWEGLGYYSRCKNLIATAKNIATNYKGKFPETYEEILALKGVGAYTAAAIASFAYNQPYAVVDGNVTRVLARYFNMATPIDSTIGKKLFTELAFELLDKKNAAIYNQAIMDFGATVCKPKLPLCSICTLQKNCQAYKNSTANELPIKQNKLKKKNRYFYFFLIENNNKIYVRKRPAKDIWENLYELFLVETESELTSKNLLKTASFQSAFKGVKFEILSESVLYKQQLSHQTIYGKFFRLNLKDNLDITGYEAISSSKMKNLAFPKFINTYLQDIKYL
jgi:A/G-specific adenine glycosylase